MLTWYRKRVRIFVIPVLVLLVSGMLSGTCRHCLAGSNSGPVADHVTGHQQHQCMDDPGQKKMKPPCDVYCDCDEYVMSMDDDRSYLLKNHRAGTEQDVSFIPAYYVTVIPPGNRLYINGKPHIPDRACFSPLQRSCILLI